MMFFQHVTASNGYNARNLEAYGSILNDTKQYNDREKANILNRIALTTEQSMIFQLFCARFFWKCNNKNIATDFIEHFLYFNGMCCAFKHSDFGWIVLPCFIKSVDLFGRPTEVTVTMPDSSKTINVTEFVLIRDNFAFTVPAKIVEYYARMIADTARTLDVYVRAMKKPRIIDADFKSSATAKQFVENILNNEHYALIDRSKLKDTENVNVIMDTSHNADDLKGLSMYKAGLYNECIARLGITTPTIIKQAQVNQDEINKNDAMTCVILNGAFKARENACKEIYELSEGELKLDCDLSPELKPDEGDGDNSDDKDNSGDENA